jgi:uncharacterized membrane protein YfcA
MQILWQMIAGILAGIFSGMGFGGGAVLLLYLTIFAGVGQYQAQGMNLLFFIPAGLFAIIFHIRKKLVIWSFAIPAAIAGIFGSALGFYLATIIGGNMLKKVFGVTILIAGIWELIAPNWEKKMKVDN